MLIHCKMPSLIMELHFPASSSFSKKRVMLTIHPYCHQMARFACFNTATQPGMTTNILRKKNMIGVPLITSSVNFAKTFLHR